MEYGWGVKKNYSYPPPKLLVCGGGVLKTETGKLHKILTSECVGALKTIYTPPKLLVCGRGLKTETGKLHEILTSVCRGSKTFLYPPKIVSVCGESKN